MSFTSSIWPAMSYAQPVPSVTVWTPAAPPVNTQVLRSSVTTQLEINATFKIQDLRLENEAP